MVLTRRRLLIGSVAVAALARMPRAWAQEAAAAAAFVESFGNKLVDVVNGDGTLPEKEQRLKPLIDGSIDVDTIAKFCLGRYAAMATPQQMTDFTRLFHDVLLFNITSKLGDYRGVTFRMGESSVRGNEAFVGTLVQRPNSAVNNVRWVVSTVSGSPKIVDVVAEGTSLRLTQRSDYSSYLNHNGNSIDSLLGAMRRQIAANG